MTGCSTILTRGNSYEKAKKEKAPEGILQKLKEQIQTQQEIIQYFLP